LLLVEVVCQFEELHFGMFTSQTLASNPLFAA
jgi:hypothetical protein